MTGIERAIREIRKAKSIAITAHVNPDGDTIGSMLSLGLGLAKMGKKIVMVSPDGVPKQYSTLPGSGDIRRKIRERVDLGITVDCNSPEMAGPPVDDLKKKAAGILAIDHHEIREPFEDFAFIDTGSASVGEMVYTILHRLKVPIDRRIAMNILTSLIVETNSFRTPNVKASTFAICGEMVATGIDFYKLVDTVFWANERAAVVLAGICMARCKFLAEGRLAWTIVRARDFTKAGGKDEDVDALPDMIRAIKGVDMVIFFREKGKGKLRVSLRSRKNINIGKLAKEYGGGGHPDVAGCLIKNTPGEISGLISRASEYL